MSQVLKTIATTLERGETVKLSSFGSFVVRQKGERLGRNPKTREPATIRPRRVLVFKPSAVLKRADKFAAWPHIGPRDREKPGRAESLRAGHRLLKPSALNSAVAAGEWEHTLASFEVLQPVPQEMLALLVQVNALRKDDGQ